MNKRKAMLAAKPLLMPSKNNAADLTLQLPRVCVSLQRESRYGTDKTLIGGREFTAQIGRYASLYGTACTCLIMRYAM